MKTGEAAQLFLNSCKAKGLSPRTIQWYGDILRQFVFRYPKLPRKPMQIEEFIASCKGGDERKHGYYRTLRRFFRFLRRHYKVKNPMELVDPPRRMAKLPRVLTPDELDQLLSFPHKAKIKASLLFLADTGARLGELARLNPGDISQNHVGYIAKVNGKTGFRYVPISWDTCNALVNYLPLGWTTDWLGRLISTAFDDAYVVGTAHTLRHTFATLWKGDEFALQRIMGHSTIVTTVRYRHLRTEQLIEQHNQYSPLRMVFTATRSML